MDVKSEVTTVVKVEMELSAAEATALRATLERFQGLLPSPDPAVEELCTALHV